MKIRELINELEGMADIVGDDAPIVIASTNRNGRIFPINSINLYQIDKEKINIITIHSDVLDNFVNSKRKADSAS